MGGISIDGDSDWEEREESVKKWHNDNLKGLEDNYKKCKEEEDRKENQHINRLRELGV